MGEQLAAQRRAPAHLRDNRRIKELEDQIAITKQRELKREEEALQRWGKHPRDL